MYGTQKYLNETHYLLIYAVIISVYSFFHVPARQWAGGIYGNKQTKMRRRSVE